MADVREVSAQGSNIRQQDNIKKTREKEEFLREKRSQEIRVEEQKRAEVSKERAAIEREEGRRLDVTA